MKKSLALTLLTTAMATGMALGTGGVANAAHCATEDSPGFSAFGQGGRNSTGAIAIGSPGASECPATTGSPSERAPGQQGR
jgi:hypothetical protein